MAATDEEIETYNASAKGLVTMLREILAADPSKEALRATISQTHDRWLLLMLRGDEKDRVLLGPIYRVVAESYVDVAFNNPMYGSRALVLQFEAAVERRLKEFIDSIKERRDVAREEENEQNKRA